MGCCYSKKKSPPPPSCNKSPDPNKSSINNKPLKPVIEIQESKPKNEEELQSRKEVFVIKHRISHEKSKTTDPENSSVSDEKSTDSNPVDVDAILIQCGRLSRSNSAAAKTRKYSGSKRSFDFDAEEADAEDEEEEEAGRRIHRGGRGESPRERGSGSGSRRVSRSPGRRSETNTSGSSVNSSNNNNNNKPAKFVSVPATDKSNCNNGEPAVKRIIVKRNIASPRSQSPARTSGNAAQPSPSKLCRKTEISPYRRNPLGEIDSNKRVVGEGLIKESGNFMTQKLNTKTATQAPMRRTASPNRGNREQQEIVEECKIMPQIVSRSRSLRKSRDFDFTPEALLSNNTSTLAVASALPSYTALLLEDIQNFHQKSVNVTVNAISSSSSSKDDSIVQVVADRNSSTKSNFKSAAGKKADLMEPSFEKYVTVKRGGTCSLEDMEEQESSGSNSITGSSGVIQRKGYSSWEPNSAESTDRANNKERRDQSPLGVMNQDFDPLKKNGRKRVDLVDSSSTKRVIQATTTRVAAVSM